MVKIYNAYSKEVVKTFDTREEADQWIGQRAYEWNYGLMREWTIEGITYYDCGPRVFYICEEKADA